MTIMRIIAKKMLREFWTLHADAEDQLKSLAMIVMRGKTHAAVTVNSEEELDAALRQLCGLMSAQSPEDLGQLEALADAVEAYERVHHPVAEPSHAGLLQHLLDAKGVSAQTAARNTRVSLKSLQSILSGQRGLLPAEARALAKYFAVDQSVFASNAEVSPIPSDGPRLGKSR